MLTTLLTLSLTLSAFASPYKRDTSLSVSMSGPASDITSIDDLKFTATVANTGSESLKVFKYGMILDDILPTHSFNVTKDGEIVLFTGVKPIFLWKDLNDSAFVVIPPRQSLTAEHDLSTLFDFASAGPGMFTFMPVTSFHMANPGEVSVTSRSINVNISGDMKKHDLPSLNRCAVDICTDNTKKNVINQSYTNAKSMASIASSFISTNSTSSVYTAYFSTSPTSVVKGVFDNVANESSRTRTMDCSDPLNFCVTGAIAFTVFPSTNIYFCDSFFCYSPLTGLCDGTADQNITRARITLHEFTHATSGTIDVIYGCNNDQLLPAVEQPTNADNYNCFASQVYQDTQCN
ncbi:Metalloprotease [Desarmillaria tabescens]|uniref:deuterolysin n=1 Tax=Armillaria tabescens TaxID=1929756 RepID=A0AA39ML03_ARMTA|nr:Metalloprotease [Desarmillaria tabescens]KAK0438721.1 Metalloprotease [Desarmillaria tabescens]